jgi:integrase
MPLVRKPKQLLHHLHHLRILHQLGKSNRRRPLPSPIRQLANTLPIPAALVPVLREYLAGRPAWAKVWNIKGKETANAIRMDLREAGLPVEVNGRVIDWHALRTTFGTRLALAGVPLAAAQRLLRHSTPVLTANIYTVLQIEDLGREVGKLV